ncbi:MAG TPA: 1-phosphofructokinase family hexose kinase [bacterium]|nr:1-phosphofructokinase family hexose kinase [bacterium]
MIITVTPNISLDKTLVVENFEIGKTHRVKDITAIPGGKGVNASRALLGMGYIAPVLGFIGGNTGQSILNMFDHEGIKYDVVKINGETRTCYNVVDPINHTQTEVLENGPIVTDNDISLLEAKITGYVKEDTIVCMGGSLPLGAPQDLYVRLVESINLKGGRVILDASGDRLKEGIRGNPFAVKPNRAEVESILGFSLDSDENIKKALDYFVAAGITLPVISMGKDGVAFYYDGKYYRITPPVLKALNAVGSGDSTVAGIALGLEKKLDIVEAVRLGAAMGSANVLTLKPGEVRKTDVDEILPKVGVTVI